MGVTVTTTPTEIRRGDALEAPRRPLHASVRPSAPSHRASAVVAAGIAGLLLALGVPRLMAAVQSLDAREALQGVYAKAPVSTERLGSAAAGLVEANRWVRDGMADVFRGVLLAQQAQRTPPGPEQDRLYREAAAATEAGLAAAPGDPNAWYRLAYLRALSGDRSGALSALHASMLAGAVAPETMVPRVELGLALLAYMDDEVRALFSRQIRLAWVIAPDFVAALGARERYAPLVQEALSSLGEDEMAHYLRLYSRKP